MRFSIRRRLCRLTFVAACVLPTLATGLTALVLHSPPYRAHRAAAWHAGWSVLLGLDVASADCESAGPGQWIVRNLELRDPASHVWLARVRTVQVARTADGYQVRLGQPQVHARHVERLAMLLHEHVLRRGVSFASPVHLAAGSLEWVGQSTSESVFELRCVLESAASGTEMLLEFRAADTGPEDRVRLRLVHNRQLDPPGTGWELHTGAASLPCSLARSWLPSLARLGEACTFQGSLWCEQQPAGWDGQLHGTLRSVELDELVTRQFPHKLSGIAELTLDECRLENGRITHVQGELQCAGGGVVSQSLLDAAEQAWGLTQHPRAGDAVLLRYGRLALNFSLTATQFTLTTPDADGAVLADSHGPLLSLEHPAPRSPLAILHLLVPHTDLQVPVSRETAAMIPLLPLPELVPAPASASQARYAPLHLHLR
jgi:hypothetical protein